MNCFIKVRLLGATLAAVMVGMAGCGGGGSGGSGGSGGGGTFTPLPIETLPVFSTKFNGPTHALVGVANTYSVSVVGGVRSASTAYDFGDATLGAGNSTPKTFAKIGRFVATSTTTNGAGGAVSTHTKNVLVATSPIVSGDSFSCALGNDNSVSCWGNNSQGRTGQPAPVSANSNTPVVVPGLNDVLALAAGAAHSCAIKLNGTVWCWGNNQYGQLGDGTASGFNGFKATPVQVVGISDAVQIAAGDWHTCAVRRVSGAVLCWGLNQNGQLGDGTKVSHTTPVASSGLVGATALAAGADHTCAAIAGGAVQCWGANSQGQIGDNTAVDRTAPTANGLTNVVSLGLGITHSCAVKSDKTVSCWGDNMSAQLGNGTSGNAGSQVALPVAGLTDAIAISAKYNYTCVLKADNTAACWGDNRAGFGSAATYLTTPTAIAGTTNGVSIGTGPGHACVLQVSGDVICWGNTGNGRLGQGAVTGSFKLTAASTTAGNAFWHDSQLVVTTPFAMVGNMPCAIKVLGGVQCWNFSGEFAGTYDINGNPNIASPVIDIAGTANAISISSNAVSGGMCIVNDNGTVACLDPSLSGAVTPIAGVTNAIEAVPYFGFDTAGPGGGGCAVLASGKVMCWGYNKLGIHGYPVEAWSAGDTPESTTVYAAREVPGISDAASITGGRNSMCVITRTQLVKCWGFNASGMLGNSTIVNAPSGVQPFYESWHNYTPTVVAGVSDVISLAMYDRRTCAVVKSSAVNGELFCWGYGFPGSTTGTNIGPTPVQISSLPGDDFIGNTSLNGLVKPSFGIYGAAANYGHDCALTQSAELKCWGGNFYGQLGSSVANLSANFLTNQNGFFGIEPKYLGPKTLSAIQGVTAFGVGIGQGGGNDNNTCALNTSGQVLCWGFRYASIPTTLTDPLNPSNYLTITGTANPLPQPSPSGAIFWRP